MAEVAVADAPTRPREVAPGVAAFAARTPTLPPATHTNSYALGTAELVLVEPATPYEDERRAWLEWARALRSSGRELSALLLTHHHADHVGGAEFFARELGVPIWAHERTGELLAEQGFDAPIARTLADGDVIEIAGPEAQRWQVLHTPGHASGHVCLFEEASGSVVVGDMVASVGTILVAPGDGDMRAYLGQLERLEALGAKVALPAHGDPIEEPSRLFRAYVTHRLLRESRVVRALAQHTEGASLAALVPDAYGDTPESVWPLAVLSLESHLLKLEADGRARRLAGGQWVTAA